MRVKTDHITHRLAHRLAFTLLLAIGSVVGAAEPAWEDTEKLAHGQTDGFGELVEIE